jgi:2-dehydropantoate 2-reductase
MTPWFILGAGALGSALAFLMHASAVPHVLLARDPRGEREVHARGSVTRISTASLPDHAPASIERLLVATKAGQIEAAINEALAYLAPGAVILTTANGLGFERDYRSAAGHFFLDRAVTTAGAFRDADGSIELVAEGVTRTGRAGVAEAPPWFTDSLAHLPGWQWDAEIDAAVAHKFAINCVINPLTALRRCRNGELLEGGSAGVDLATLCDETEPALRILGLWQGTTALEAAAAQVCRQTAGNRSSMLQDVLAGRETELAYLTGELLRRGHAAGLDLPRNRALFDALI